jgi:hypothetical protein
MSLSISWRGLLQGRSTFGGPVIIVQTAIRIITVIFPLFFPVTKLTPVIEQGLEVLDPSASRRFEQSLLIAGILPIFYVVLNDVVSELLFKQREPFNFALQVVPQGRICINQLLYRLVLLFQSQVLHGVVLQLGLQRLDLV